MKRLRIGIVNDVRLAQEVLKRFVNSVPEFEVAWIAADGLEAIEMAGRDTPDLILMDLIMPLCDGVKATRDIMRKSPCAILIVTANPVDNSSKIYEAMGYGALDVVMTPAITHEHDQKGVKELYKKVETISKLIGKPMTTLSKGVAEVVKERESFDSKPPPLVVIGSSTGGPFALSSILSQFPANSPYAFVIVQHVDQQFAPGFASWLGSQIQLPVRIAEQNDEIKPGFVFVAGKNDHLILSAGRFLKYTPVPEDIFYRPSVDVFFQSVAQNWPSQGVAVLLTGMGSDGGLGMKALFNRGWHTIAEHQNSCVVYGMPKAAVDLGAARQVLLLEKIPSAIVSALKTSNNAL